MSSYQDFESKKTIHFTTTREAHSQLRIQCFKSKISMQELFDEVTQRVAVQSPDVMLIIEDISLRKKTKELRKLSQVDAESVFNIIENDNPLMGVNEDD